MIRSLTPEEYPITLYVNGEELATYQLSKADLKDWAAGYLYAEGIIEGPDDLQRLSIDESRNTVLAEVARFNKSAFGNKKKHYTAGCGKGMTFFSMTDVKKFNKVNSKRAASISYLLKKRHEFAQASPMYLSSGGMHGACIILPDGTITVREDIGRHNAVDKILGHALLNGLNPEELILLTTGRISYEMLSKSARFGIGIIGSRTAATKQAVELARFLNIELVGYLRGKMATVYTSSGRVLNDVSEKAAGG
ncbi:formate dehydrogenase accessory sulfurtransferase FdhD [Bacillus marinisedimentorum]|uniref:formate dehydrogenase accessory sulfurtransferase FdhD n=1 Tax=Bacillus marinisedimentorum TaxID=1821260 RepID=UPI000871EB62|nr:formate dehydrogenase accessory sulfurtransferase FdhD [Bacillus marinisedimentorum]